MTPVRPRICFILSTRGFAYGGLETIADNLSAGLAARGHDVTLLAGRAPGSPPRADFPAGIKPLLVPLLPQTAPLLRRAARILRTPPLHLQSMSFSLACLIHPESRTRLRQADAVVTFLEGEAVLFSHFLARREIPSLYYFSGGVQARWAYRDRSTLRIAISRTVAENAVRRHAYPVQGVVTPGIDAEFLAQPVTVPDTSDPPRLLYVGRIERNKRAGHLLPLVAALAPDFPELTLQIIGDGPDRPAMERAARAARLDRRVIFRGALPPAKVQSELRRATLFVFPSSYESFGVAALEAQAAGVPVVATDTPGLREATGGKACLLPDDPALWYTTLAGLLRDPLRRRALAEAGRTWAAGFTWDRSVAQLAGHLDRLRVRSSGPAGAEQGG